MTRPKVLVYCTQLLATGGIESHIRQFCKCLSEAGVIIDLVVPNFTATNADRMELLKSCRHVYTFRSSGAFSRTIWLCAILLRLNLHRYDALYTNGQGSSILFVSRMLQARKRWLHHHHTSGDEADLASWTRSYLCAIRTADGVIACSETNAQAMREAVGRSFITIPCFSRQIAAKEPKSVAGRALVFGYYGRLIKEKGIDLLCECSNASELSDIEFHIWGTSSSYDAKFFNGFPRTHFHGSFHTRRELQQVIETIDAFVLASTHPEGLPISLLEVMSAGKPWIATDRGGIRDIAHDNDSTVLLPIGFSKDDVVDAIRGLADRIRSRRIDAAKQRLHYKTKYSETAIRDRWMAVLFSSSKDGSARYIAHGP